VAGLSPVRLLTKLPVPTPSIVLLLDIVGSADVFQHTPLAVIAAPPSEVIFPPLEAVVPETEVTVEVVTVGISALVVKVS
jgi:hypothetical protein